MFEAKEKLTAFDPEAQDSFGNTVAISGDYAIVGATFEDPKTLDKAGSAYIFRRTSANTWDAGMKVVSPDRETDDRFGVFVAISGDYVIVGANWKIPIAGAAYIFHRTGTNTWDTGTKIIAPDAETNDQFGKSVAISGNTVIVGVFGEDPDDLDSAGAAYLFQRTDLNAWDRGTKILPLTQKPLIYSVLPWQSPTGPLLLGQMEKITMVHLQ